VHNAPRFSERKAPQEQIVDQTEDCSVRANRERERDHGDDGESWCFSQRTESVFEVGDHEDSLYSLGDNDGEIVFIRHEVQ